MSKKQVIAIFDIGKTNKKLFLFDEEYNIVFERTAKFTEITDEDGFACENIDNLRLSVFDSLREVSIKNVFDIRAINFATYGASFVFLDVHGEPVAPLYNYLKPFPPDLLKKFYDDYGGEESFAYRTASPVLGNLNSGMQLYRIKYQKPELFKEIKYALHLPQYMSYLISGLLYSDITSVGCHTNLWDFQKNEYHEWVKKEGIEEKLLPIVNPDKANPVNFQGNKYITGVGVHDSSAALIPYLVSFQEPFVLISTGTWCITLNPFNDTPLTKEELKNDCLCYMQYNGKPVKAARLFAGNEHDQQVKRIAEHFSIEPGQFKTIIFDDEIVSKLKKKQGDKKQVSLTECAFRKRELTSFSSAKEAYHCLLMDIIDQQFLSTGFVLDKKIKRIFVDGGFSNNDIYMNLLAAAFPGIEVYATSMAQATALGAALVMHSSWNKKTIPGDLVSLKFFAVTQSSVM